MASRVANQMTVHLLQYTSMVLLIEIILAEKRLQPRLMVNRGFVKRSKRRKIFSDISKKY